MKPAPDFRPPARSGCRTEHRHAQGRRRYRAAGAALFQVTAGLQHQARLADTGIASDEHIGRVSEARRSKDVGELSKGLVAPDQGRPRSHDHPPLSAHWQPSQPCLTTDETVTF